jgi:hypothetical protein
MYVIYIYLLRNYLLYNKCIYISYKMPPYDFQDFEIKHHYVIKDKQVFLRAVMVSTSLWIGYLYYLWR